jgi:NAD(P)-dependent dehydrogenase (short-subunit alcohol dehydrogenase family)
MRTFAREVIHNGTGTRRQSGNRHRRQQGNRARDREALDETVKLARGRDGVRVEALQADLNKPEDVKSVAARGVEAFGKIDILVNNAGSARPGDFQKLTDDEWLEDWNLKFFGYVRMAREVLPQMQRQGHGVIVNVIGTGALIG